MKKAIIKLALVLMVSTGLIACGSTDKAVNQSSKDLYSGFLKDYSQLSNVKSDDDSLLKTWFSDSIDSTKYKKLLIEPIVFYPKAPVGPQVSEDVLEEIKNYFNQAMKNEMGNAFELTEQAGDDVVRVKVAITGINIDDKSLSAYQYIPVAFLVTAASGNLNNLSVKMQVEGELTDSITGKSLAAGVKRAEGEKLKSEEVALSLDNLKPLIDRWLATFRDAIAVKIM